MRDDHLESTDRQNAERGSAIPGPQRVAGDHGSSTDGIEESTADTPAALSATSHPADVEEAGLSDEEIQMYRRRVADGLYNSREVADEVARRMMKRGDI
jgi:hypothetical protein